MLGCVCCKNDTNPMNQIQRVHAVRTAAAPCGPETAQIVGLIFTELVTNSIVHAGLGPEGRISVSLEISNEGIRGSVRDHGAGFDIGDGPEPRADGGFGLFIVQRMTRRWGVESSPGSTEVWFEL